MSVFKYMDKIGIHRQSQKLYHAHIFTNRPKDGVFLKFVIVYKAYLRYNEQTGALVIFTISACCMWQTLVLSLPNLPSTEVWSRPQVGDFLPPSVPMAEVIEKSKVSPQKNYTESWLPYKSCDKKRKRSQVLAHAFIFRIRWYSKTHQDVPWNSIGKWMYDTVPFFPNPVPENEEGNRWQKGVGCYLALHFRGTG